MDVIVRKPTAEEKEAMQKHPVWSCGVSEFDWYYDRQETCLILEGSVTVEFDGGSVQFGAGDYVIFAQNLSCVWKVTAPVKKHYVFG